MTAVVVAKLCREFAARRWKTLSSDLRPVRRHGPNGVRPSGQVLNESLSGKTYISDALLYPRPLSDTYSDHEIRGTGACNIRSQFAKLQIRTVM